MEQVVHLAEREEAVAIEVVVRELVLRVVIVILYEIGVGKWEI